MSKSVEEMAHEYAMSFLSEAQQALFHKFSGEALIENFGETLASFHAYKAGHAEATREKDAVILELQKQIEELKNGKHA